MLGFLRFDQLVDVEAWPDVAADARNAGEHPEHRAAWRCRRKQEDKRAEPDRERSAAQEEICDRLRIVESRTHQAAAKNLGLFLAAVGIVFLRVFDDARRGLHR